MNPATIEIGVELVRMLIRLSFQEAEKVGMSAEETKALLEEERKKYRKNIPENIPDV